MGQHIGGAYCPVHAQHLEYLHIFRISHRTDRLFNGKQALGHLTDLQVIRVLLSQSNQDIISFHTRLIHDILLAGITIDDRSGVVGRGQMLTVPHIPVDCYNLMFSHQKKPNQEIRLISSTCNHNLHEIPAS